MNVFVVTTLDSFSLTDDGLLSFSEALALAVIVGGESIIRFAPGLAGNVELGTGPIEIPDGVVIEPNSDITFLDVDFTGTVTDDLGSPFVNDDPLNSPAGDGTLVLEDGSLLLRDERSEQTAATGAPLTDRLVLNNSDLTFLSTKQFAITSLTNDGLIEVRGDSGIGFAHSGPGTQISYLSAGPTLSIQGEPGAQERTRLDIFVSYSTPEEQTGHYTSALFLSAQRLSDPVDATIEHVDLRVIADVGDREFRLGGPLEGTITVSDSRLAVLNAGATTYGTSLDYQNGVALFGSANAIVTASSLYLQGDRAGEILALGGELTLDGSFASLDGSEGDDIVAGSFYSVALSKSKIYAAGGRGNDVIQGGGYGLTLTSGDSFDEEAIMFLDGEVGHDTIYANFEGPISGNGSIFVLGDSGNDTVAAGSQLRLDGVSLYLDGGEDDDLLVLALVTGEVRDCTGGSAPDCTPNIANDTVFEISGSIYVGNYVKVLGASGDDTVVGIATNIMDFGATPIPNEEPLPERITVDPVFNPQFMDLRGFEGNLVLDGGDGDDEVTLSEVSATILGGFIELRGSEGNDTVLGVDGDVRLANFAPGADIFEALSIISIDGGAGNDVLQLATGEVIDGEIGLLGFGASGNDTLFGTSIFDVMYGGEGDDLLYASKISDIVFGGAGTDTFSAANLTDPVRIVGGIELGVTVNLAPLPNPVNDEELALLDRQDFFDGIENIEGSDFSDFLNGDDQANTIMGGDGGDFLTGGGGDDLLEGGAGFDALEGGAGADSLFGGEGLGDVATYFDADGPLTFVFDGNLQSFAAGTSSIAADDVIGADVEGIFGSSAFSNTFDASSLTELTFLLGGGDSDTFIGGAGTDQLLGLGGDDVIYGGAGGDGIIGGVGDDDLFGGAGMDAFFFGGAGDDNDIIHDLELGPGGDVIFIGGGLTAADLTFADADSGGTEAVDTLITYATGGSIVVIDLDAAAVEAGATILFG
ncbi:MAG: calcium-binding protein [Pseudomonadota bacterium]